MWPPQVGGDQTDRFSRLRVTRPRESVDKPSPAPAALRLRGSQGLAIASLPQSSEGGDQGQPLAGESRVVEVASGDNPGVGQGHRLHPKLGRTAYVVWTDLIEVAIEPDQAGDERIVVVPRVMLLLTMHVPPRDFQFGGDLWIDGQPAGLVGHPIEPRHMLPSGYRIIVWIRCPYLVCAHHVPSCLEISQRSEPKAVPHHAE